MFNEVYLSIKTDSGVSTMCKCHIKGSPTEIIAAINEPIDKYTVNQVSKAFKPVVKGKWIDKFDATSYVKQLPRKWIECSNCGWTYSCDRKRDKYCSNCGAEMEVQE